MAGRHLTAKRRVPSNRSTCTGLTHQKSQPVISTEAQAARRAERSGETSNFSSGKVARSANVMQLRTTFARRRKV